MQAGIHGCTHVQTDKHETKVQKLYRLGEIISAKRVSAWAERVLLLPSTEAKKAPEENIISSLVVKVVIN